MGLFRSKKWKSSADNVALAVQVSEGDLQDSTDFVAEAMKGWDGAPARMVSPSRSPSVLKSESVPDLRRTTSSLPDVSASRPSKENSRTQLDTSGEESAFEELDEEDETRQLPSCHVVEATENHTATVIWLHGYGDQGSYFNQLPAALSVPWCRFIFPNAPTVVVDDGGDQGGSVSLNSWFEAQEVPSMGDAMFSQEGGLAASAKVIQRIVANETRSGVPAQRIVLAGFAQGGVVAMQAAVGCRHRLAGLVVMSSWLPREGQSLKMSRASRRMKALFCHGHADPVVSVRRGKEAYHRLQTLGVHAEFREYAHMAHDFCPPELRDIKSFIMNAVPKWERLHTAKSNPLVMEGPCQKRADHGIQGMRPWGARFLVLRDNVVAAYASEADHDRGEGVLAEHDLAHCSVAASDKKKPGRSIEVSDVNETSTYYHFSSHEEREEWLRVMYESQDWQKQEDQRRMLMSVQDVPNMDAVVRKGGLHSSCLCLPSFSSCLPTLIRTSRACTNPSLPVQPVMTQRAAKWENLVFSGGGVKVMAFPAALSVIADAYGDDGPSLRWVKRVAGVSGGSVLAIAVACGCTVEDMLEVSHDFNVGEIADSIQRSSTLQTMRRLFNNWGAFDGGVLAEKVDALIYRFTGLSGATFQQLYDHTGILLKIFATSLRNGDLIEFSALRTPHDQVAMASRCSMAVPFLFDAMPTSEGDLLVDAALIDNCPVGCFDEGDKRNDKTLAFWLATRINPQQAAPRSVSSFCVRMIDLVLFMQQKQQKLSFYDDDRVMWVKSPDIPISTFRLSASEQALLYRCGRSSARHFLRSTEPRTPYDHVGHHVTRDHNLKTRFMTRALGQRVPAADASERWRDYFKNEKEDTEIELFVRYWLAGRQRKVALLPRLGKAGEREPGESMPRGATLSPPPGL